MITDKWAGYIIWAKEKGLVIDEDQVDEKLKVKADAAMMEQKADITMMEQKADITMVEKKADITMVEKKADITMVEKKADITMVEERFATRAEIELSLQALRDHGLGSIVDSIAIMKKA